jgi:DNA-binding transcriptional LysR family regulator
MESLASLRIFAAVCETGSLSAVARAEGCTQSAVSQHVKRLEADHGVALVERSRSGVTPTPAGDILYRAVQDSLGTLTAARRRLRELREGEAGTLRITTGGTTLRHFMIEALARLRHSHPGLAIEFRSATSTAGCIEEVRANRADLAFVTLGPPTRGLQQRPVVQAPWVLVAPRDDPLVEGERIDPRRLRQARYLAMHAGSRSRKLLEAQLAEHGVHLDPVATVDDWDTAVRLVEVGLGHAVVPALWVHDLGEHDRLRALPLDGVDPATFGWIARRWDALNPLALAFVAETQRQLGGTEHAAGIALVEPAT